MIVVAVAVAVAVVAVVAAVVVAVVAVAVAVVVVVTLTHRHSQVGGHRTVQAPITLEWMERAPGLNKTYVVHIAYLVRKLPSARVRTNTAQSCSLASLLLVYILYFPYS